MTFEAVARRALGVPGVGMLVADTATGVRVDAEPGADPAEVDGLLRGSGAALLWQLRCVLPLHVAAVARNGRAIGFVGPPGTGKSSLAAALSERGWQLVTDDIAAVRWDDEGHPLLEPNPPQLRIWGSSARQLGWDTSDEHRLGAPSAGQVGDKYAYDLPERFADHPVRLAAVYLINPPRAAPDIAFSQILGKKRFDVFHRGATYNAEFLDTPDARAWHFTETLRLAQQVSAWHLTQPMGATLGALADAVQRHATPTPTRKRRGKR